MKKYLPLFAIIGLILALSPRAHADTFINVNVAAYHYDRKITSDNNFNESNFGIGIELIKSDVGAMFGEYKNSIYDTSWYALARYSPIHIGIFSVGLAAGGVTGYRGSIVKPAAGLIFTAQHKRIGLNLLLTPNIPEDNVYGFAGLQLRLSI